jgi:type I restriction enzyme, S subunit
MSQWPKVPLGQLLDRVSRPESVSPEVTYRILGAHWYAHGLYTKDTLTGGEIQAPKVYRVAKGDFVYNRLFAWKGSFAVATEDNDGCYVSNEFPCFLVQGDRLDAHFLKYYFSRESSWTEALGLSSGGTPTSRNRLKEEAFLQLQIPLPPLPEQQRLVERIDALAAKIEEAKRLRCEADKERSALESSFTNDIFSHATMAWPRRPLGELADIQSGVTLGRSISGPTSRRPYLRVANVQDGYFDLSVIKEIDIRPDEFEKWKLLPGDLLLTEGGDWDKLGRGAVWRGEIPDCIHQNHIFRVRVAKDVIDPEFLALLTASPYGKSYFQDASKQTTNLASINQRQLKAFPVFVPSIDEQQHTISRVYALREKLRVSHKAQTESGREINAMIPAILDRAFRGEL